MLVCKEKKFASSASLEKACQLLLLPLLLNEAANAHADPPDFKPGFCEVFFEEFLGGFVDGFFVFGGFFKSFAAAFPR